MDTNLLLTVCVISEPRCLNRLVNFGLDFILEPSEHLVPFMKSVRHLLIDHLQVRTKFFVVNVTVYQKHNGLVRQNLAESVIGESITKAVFVNSHPVVDFYVLFSKVLLDYQGNCLFLKLANIGGR